ncbi:hypothetical protein ACFL18_02280 [Patescibacteria group bacterium]
MSKKKSLHLTAGLTVGAAIAAGAAFLYKTEKGKQIRKQFQGHLNEAKPHIGNVIKKIKSEAKKLEKDLKTSEQELAKKTKTTKKKLDQNLKLASSEVKKRVFSKSGKPLAK